MAKNRTRDSRSQHIRDYLQDHPEATPTQIVEGLAVKGIHVTASLAGNVKYTSGPKGKRNTGQKTAQKKVVRRAVAKRSKKKMAPRRAAAGLTAEDLFEAKKLADELGGIAEARKALDALEKLT